MEALSALLPIVLSGGMASAHCCSFTGFMGCFNFFLEEQQCAEYLELVGGRMLL